MLGFRTASTIRIYPAASSGERPRSPCRRTSRAATRLHTRPGPPPRDVPPKTAVGSKFAMNAGEPSHGLSGRLGGAASNRRGSAQAVPLPLRGFQGTAPALGRVFADPWKTAHGFFTQASETVLGPTGNPVPPRPAVGASGLISMRIIPCPRASAAPQGRSPPACDDIGRPSAFLRLRNGRMLEPRQLPTKGPAR